MTTTVTTTEQNRAGTDMDTTITHPLTSDGFPADRSVLETHPDARAISARIAAEDGLARVADAGSATILRAAQA